ncbi:MAG: cellobiose phosphorylase [Brevefilum sp.]|nr:cellobiose phosphorylase [Brevefilum sp.]
MGNKQLPGDNQFPGWTFVDDQGTFELINPEGNSYVYFPLVNPAGMMSSITPTLNGDAKLNQDTFLLLPVSVEDLHNVRSGRNFWVRINGEPWSVTGNSAQQISQVAVSPGETSLLQAGVLWHSVQRGHLQSGLTAKVVNFVPVGEDAVELMQVTLTNQGEEPLELVPIAAIPIFGRSADNLRDHRHVTSLLHQTTCHPYGVMVKPTMSFDERGHQINRLTYAVLGVDGDGNPPDSLTPLVEDFIGEGGSLAWPEAVVTEEPKVLQAPAVIDGYESIGALHFSPIRLAPGESKRYVLMLSILSEPADVDGLIERYGSQEKFALHLEANRTYWREELASLRFTHNNDRLDAWLGWVSLQPILRRLMGNSFLPYHDYGRGGRGWRDLWQDLLTLLLTQENGIDQLLLGNFAGVRMDGSNATIVGGGPGEFKADRNNIPRVWMDHGAWPLITTKLYLDLTGDLDLLLARQTYFKDHLSHRCQRTDWAWQPEDGTQLRSSSGEVVEGTILEHLLVQHLTAFFNVGEHHLIKMEGGDWNDAFDMAAERGESVAFSALYAGNLHTLSELCLALADAGTRDISLAAELLLLLDRVSDPVDYQSLTKKQDRLGAYFDRVQGRLSGDQVKLPLESVAADLDEKAAWLTDRIRGQEWLTDDQGLGWFNGYYDNQGERVEGQFPDGVRMTLTGQVFPLMCGIASEDQARAVVRAANAYLYDPNLNGHRLNTDFGISPPQLGRCFGFAFGHKENGAVFSHMAVMYAYALYQQGLAAEAWGVLAGLYRQSQDFPKSRIYPGIPEYFNPRGRGMYPYLTGSASWYLFTLLTEAFGVKGELGDLYLAPKLAAEQFEGSDSLRVQTMFAGKKLSVTYHNQNHLSFGDYQIGSLSINGIEQDLQAGSSSIRFSRQDVLTWPDDVQIVVNLV